MSKWIWQNGQAKIDEHAEFFTEFCFSEEMGAATLVISADSDYCVYVNGKPVYHGQYADYPHYKVYDSIDVTPYLAEGKNALAVEVWYFGESSSVYTRGEAGLWFSVSAGDRVLCQSGEGVLSRLSRCYKSHEKKIITAQIGYSYFYDVLAEDGWKTDGGEGFAPSVAFDRNPPAVERPIKRLLTGAPIAGVPIMREKGRILIDFGKECVGIPHLRFTSPKRQKLHVCWGEHIVDGKVRDVIGTRDFSFDLFTREGENDFTGYFRRLGLRYMELYSEDDIEALQAEILPRSYPLEDVPFDCGDSELQRIYDVSVYTLKMCMHEHYEDCPWREQALYAMDSRNQILCGYYAFKEYVFPRSCLKLISEDRRADGMLSICYPSDVDLTIPSFGLHYFTEVREYADYSGDWQFVAEVMPKLESVLAAYTRHEGKSGLLPTFTGENYWNFYEWSDGLEGTLFKSEEQKVDLVLNCLYSIALQHMAYMCGRLQIKNDYLARAEGLNAAIDKQFFSEEDGAYSMYAGKRTFNELGNSLAILCGAATGSRAGQICRRLAEGNEWTEVTLSMRCFKYDAILLVGGDSYAEYVIEDIRRVYLKMLAAGATTFWETEKGERDFENAGSLCHGWSAMPVYYFNRLLKR